MFDCSSGILRSLKVGVPGSSPAGPPLQRIIRNYNFACLMYVWMCNLVSHIEGKIQAQEAQNRVMRKMFRPGRRKKYEGEEIP
jgi:hypothetical protein